MNLSQSAKKTLLICIGLGLFLMFFYVTKKALINHFISKFTQKKPYVHAIHPKAITFTKYYHTVGEFKALKSVELSPSMGGHVESIFFKANDKVHKGQLLVQLEDKVESAQKSLQWAEYKLQKKLHEQYLLLWEKHNISKTQYLESQARLEKAKAAYTQARAQWELKKIRAPFSGTLGIANIYPGLYISPGQKDLVQLVQLKPLVINFYLPERYFLKIHLGDFIKINKSNAQIIAIEPFSQQLAHTIRLRAQIDNNNLQYIPGQFVKIKVAVAKTQHLLSIPSASLVNSPQGTHVFKAVYSKKTKTYTVFEKYIHIDQNLRENTIITKGIDVNDWIIDAGTHKIQNGQEVHLKG